MLRLIGDDLASAAAMPDYVAVAHEIRRIATDDVDAVVSLALRAWAPVFKSFQQVLGTEIYQLVYPDWLRTQADAVATACRGAHVWVAVHGGKPIGFIAVVMRDDVPERGEIDMLAVDPDFQRRGTATQLITVALDFMRAQGVRLADIGTGGDPGHAAARRTYETAGFTGLPLVRYYRSL